MDRVNDVSGCFGDGTNNTTTIRYTAPAAPGRADPIPAGWYGEFVRVLSKGADSSFFFSKSSSAACDPTIAASATGAQAANQGEPALDGVEKTVLVPTAGPNETVYLVRASAGTVTYFALTKGSGKLGNNTVRDS